MQKKLYLTYLSLLVVFLAPAATAISVGVSQGGGGVGTSGLSMGYDLDSSTGLSENIVITGGAVFGSRFVEGRGNNSISQTASNRDAILSGDVSSSGTLSSSGSAYASGESVGLSQNVYATGISEAGVAGSTGSNGAAQDSAALDGSMASSQVVSSQGKSLSALQSSDIVAAVGYVNGKARSDDNEIKITGGLNGPGAVSSVMGAVATDGARASGLVQTASLESKAYSAAQATSAEADAFSYLSSDDRLASSLSASAAGHVDASQEIDSRGSSLIYASTNHDGSSTDYSVTSEKSVAGKLSVNAGSPQVINPELSGDVANSVNGLTAMPGSWVWNDLSGMMNSNPFILRDNLGQRHVFAKGSDNGLYDNLDGDWRGLGGSIASDPYAVNDDKNRVHIFAKGSSGGLVDRMLDSYTLSGSWLTLGTTMAGSPSAALTPGKSNINIAVRDLDNTLWIRSLDTGTLTGSWTNRGGTLNPSSNPYVAYDSAGKMHTLVRYSDNTLRDNVDGTWKNLGGSITSDAKPLVNPAKPGYVYTYARDSDGSLVSNALNTATGTSTWTDLGGTISAGTSSSIYRGNPAPVLDSSGVTHIFTRGTDGALWENANGMWTSRGGAITSDPSAVNSDGLLEVAARGSTGKLSLAQPEVFGAWPNPTGNVIGGGSGYKKIIPRSKAKYVVSDSAGLISALSKAVSGDIVYVDDNAQIDMTGKRNVNIPAGVTIASGRGNGASQGGLIYSNDQGDDITVFSAKQNVRLTGVRLRGPSGARSTTLSTNGIKSSYTGFEVDNCEIFNWPHAGVVVNGGSTNAKIHHNYIHNNQKDGIGYGVVLGSGNAVATIEGNIFDYNRHHVAGVGTTGNKYEFRYNKVLEHDTITEGLDMHGGYSRGDGTNIAGDWMKVHHNTFGLTKYPAIGISGIPNDGLYVYNNWFTHSEPRYTYVQTHATGHVYVYNNQYGL